MQKQKKIASIIKDVIFWAVLITITVLVVTTLKITIVDGDSMNDTLHDGDKILITRNLNNIKRYDIIVFNKEPETSIKTNYIKRVIGLPGESVRIDGNNIYINGELLTDDIYGKEPMKKEGLAKTEIILGEHDYFVLGDNRNNSKDSRDATLGKITVNDIVGKALFRIIPNFGKID